MSEPIWFKDPSILFSSDTWQKFVPTKDMTLAQVNELALEKKNAKATASATLRSQAKSSGWSKVGIIWDTNNVPNLKKIS